MCMFNFSRDYQSALYGVCIIFHSYQQCMRVSVAQNPHQHLVWSVVDLWIFNISHSHRHVVVSHCVSYVHLPSVYIFWWCVQKFGHSFIVFFYYCWVLRAHNILWIQVFCQICDLQILSLSWFAFIFS